MSFRLHLMEHLSSRVVQVTELRQDIDGALKKTSGKEFLKIIRRGHEIGVLMRPETYGVLSHQIDSLHERLEGLEETMAILADKKLMVSLKKSLVQMKKGKLKSWEEAFGENL